MKQNRIATDAQRRRRPWLVCAVLAVVLARGPVPWLHCHELLADHVHSEDTLAWHLKHFHLPGDDHDHGWHIHWTLPWQIVNCPCQHDNAPSEERASVLEMPFDVAQSAPLDQAEADRHAGAPPPMLTAYERGDRPPWDPLSVAGLHFLETYFPTVTLRALYCVARC